MNRETDRIEVTLADLRKFGLIMGVMITLIFGLIFPWIGDKTVNNWPIWPYIVTALFWLVALVAPRLLKPINKAWVKIGDVLGFINSRIILGVMFFLLIFPIGLVLKILGKDSMNRKYNKDLDSYRKVVIPRNKNHLEKPF